jgi:Na+-transporting NADH:ubiquinone oxidoreductase subunit A
VINFKKGLDLPIAGNPSVNISDAPKVSAVSVLANDYIGMKPTMFVKAGDTVKVGSKIFEDKKNPGVFFTSPAGGTISSINRGDKRKFLSVEIDISNDEQFHTFTYESDADSLKSLMIDSGLWNSFRTRPFNRTPKTLSMPDALFINACDTNPLAVDPINYHTFSGPHPAGLSSVHISHIYPVNLKRVAWTIGFQDVISLGYLLKNKKLRTHKTVAIAGPSVFEPSLLSARIGGNLDELTAGKIKDSARVISGSVLFGHSSEGVMRYLGNYDSLISVIPDEANDIFMNWLMPGKNLHSKLNIFSSSFITPKEFIFNTSLNGGDRAIVPIGSYDEVLPMDILVTQLLKSLVISDIEVAVDLGMLELAPEDLALCSYVCPSKYDYSSILLDNLNKLYLEQ